MHIFKKTVWNLLSKKTTNNLDEIVKIILANRGLKSKNTVKEFLNPQNPYKLDLSLLGILNKDLKKSINRIKEAILKKELIILYGDYDADGITGTAVLWETLHLLGAKAMPFIPNRAKHGYGLNPKGIDSALAKYRSGDERVLIITVDNGIVAFEGADYCQDLNIDLIITDHHQKKLKLGKKNNSNKKEYFLPKSQAIFWSDKTSGAAVAWFLARELYSDMKDKDLTVFKKSNTLELAAIGTIADMMPLMGVNRSLTYFGLRELNQSKRIGIKALISKAAFGQAIGTYEVNFVLGPRINAMGRLAEALDSLRLLCTKDINRAKKLAKRLGLINKKRQDITRNTLQKAEEIIEKKRLYKNKLLFVTHKDFNPGVIGLVAGRLSEKYSLPTVLVAILKETGKGSVRSVKGFNIINFLRQFDNLFADLGGHPMAAGFNISLSNLKKLEQALIKKANEKIKNKDLRPLINIDCQLDLNTISWDLFDKLKKLEPFGIANSKPTFLSKKAELLNFRKVGVDGKHLKLTIGNFDAIAFNLGDWADKLSLSETINIVFSLEKNVWNGKKSLQLRVKDISLES